MTHTNTPTNQRIVLLFIFLLCTQITFACSAFKITANGKTFVGNNEDAWRINPKLWFVPGANGTYGVVYVGANDVMSQGGINEKGLMYDGFSIMPKEDKPAGIDYAPKDLLREIMETCATVLEVKEKLKPYNRYFFTRGMLFMVDKHGDYLVIEPDTIVEGNDPKYILTNFCPSVTFEKDVPQKRYWRGRAFLEHRNEADLTTALGMMDTMSECREKMGDGTMYTSLYDLDSGNIYLYFYHDYKHEVKLNIAEELAKGERKILISDLFPRNEEYEKLRSFQTPFNNGAIIIFMAAAALMFLVSAIFFIGSYIKTRKHSSAYIKLLLAALNLAMVYYVWSLITNEGIYYFAAPYKAPGNLLLTIASYLPIVLAITFIPILLLNVSSFKNAAWTKLAVAVLTIDTLLYLGLLLLFGYWGLLVLV